MKALRTFTLSTLTMFTLTFLSPAIPVTPVAHAQSDRYSDLWGKNGEKWDSDSRLPDFSFAGYHAGEKSIPKRPEKANVKKFGAKGDGKTDDTKAFKAAIKATKDGALYIPAGRYKITDILKVDRSRVVLRGAGEGNTTLMFSKSLQQIMGKAPYGKSAMIEFRGKNNGKKLTNVTRSALRGDTKLQVSSTSGIKAGQMIRLLMKNPTSNSLGCYLYADQGCLNKQRQAWYNGEIVDWAVEVKAVRGNTIELVRPLRLDVISQWQPQIWQHRPNVEEVGLEDLTIQFPNEQYAGHHKEAGYYAVYFESIFNGWIRRVTVKDADRGIEIYGGGYNTVAYVTLDTRYRKLSQDTVDNATGHYGFQVGGLAQDNLFTESELRTQFVHNLSVGAFVNGNVYAAIVSESARFDHHGAAPYENLFTEIVLTKTGSDLLKSGGNRKDEPSAGARTTLWNIVSVRNTFPKGLKKNDFPQINIIGLNAWATTKTSNKEWIEKWPGALTEPPNLYEAQLKARRP